MMLLGLILLVSTEAFATNYEVKPSANLIFNFEQLRRDQPPQIEMRDESLGLYMHRRPQTTTTTIAPIVVQEIAKFPENDDLRLTNPIPHVNNEYSYQYNPVHIPSTPIPVPRNQNHVQYAPWPSPPPAPQWSDLSEAFKKQGVSYYETQKPFEHNTVVQDFTYVQQQMTTPSAFKPQEQTMPVAPEFSHRNEFRNPVQATQYHPTTAPFKPRGQLTKAAQRPLSRGNHKFNWDDLNTQPNWSQTSQHVTTTTVRMPTAKVSGPHPIPTLTPWSDGF